MKEHIILTQNQSELILCGTIFGELEELQTLHIGRVVVPIDELPADFSVDTYTIADGALAPASADVIACREAAALVASREAVRVAREARYESEPIKSLYWSWIESGLDSDRTAWIVAKNAIRTELPYPENPTAV